MLGKVIGRHEGEDVGFEAFQIGIMERLNGRLFDGSVHAFCLTVRPRVIRLGELVLDAVLIADAIENVGAEISPGRPVAVLWQIGERHAVVGQHGVDCIRECVDRAAQEIGAVHLAGGVAELDVGELRDPVDGEEHVELALGQAQLADVDVDVANGRLGELAPLGCVIWVLGREMPWRSRQRCRLDRVSVGMLSRRHPSTSSSASRVRRRNSTIMASSTAVRTVL